jgi:hypothetical protein
MEVLVLKTEVYANGGKVGFLKGAVGESAEEGRLSD